MMRKFLFCLLFLSMSSIFGQGGTETRILSMRDRAQLRDAWLETRFQTVLPEVMRRHKIDMWVIIAREYNEDPVIKTMQPATWISSRRRTIIVFFDQGPEKGIERLAVARYDIGKLIKGAWEKEKQPDQWKRLAEIITERDPKKIALNYSSTFPLGDGVTMTEYKAFENSLSASLRKRIVSGEMLAVGWLERRTPQEMEVYKNINALAHEIIEEGFSSSVIQPGFTTTKDVEWWYRERIRELKLVTWFHPSVSIQRRDNSELRTSFSSKPSSKVIHRGDLLHVDFGINYLGLNTDTQRHAYVLRLGETEPPAGLKKALAVGNRLQDILLSNYAVGRTGNEILLKSLKQAKSEGIVPSIYTHPIGFHGHAAGMTVGMWDSQGGVPGKGDYKLFPRTAYSIELNVTVSIPEWDNKKIKIMLEEDAYFGEDSIDYISGRATELIIVH